MTNWKKYERAMERHNEFYEFGNPGDVLEGIIQGFREISTKYGKANVADIYQPEINKSYSVIVSSGLHLDEDLQGMMVKIVFNGYTKNPKSGRLYKQFEVYTQEVDDVKSESSPF